MKEIISFADFTQIDIRVGEVSEATIPEWSKKLIRLTVQFGEEIGERIIFAGLKTWYQPEDFINKKFLFIVNLPEKKMGEEKSQGMLLVIDNLEKPILLSIPQDTKLGLGIC